MKCDGPGALQQHVTFCNALRIQDY